MRTPQVTVLMPVYNGQRFLVEAIESILAQSFKDFEFLIINDGSKDKSEDIIKRYAKKDSRIRFISRSNKGLVATLNEGLTKTKGKFIARMDCDDVSHPERLKKQVDYMEKNKKIALLGTSFNIIDENNCAIGHSYHLDRNEDLQMEFLVRNPFGHGTVMVRREVLKSVGGYDESQAIEDYELWWRISQKYETANIPEELYSWRVVSGGISHGSSEKRQKHIHNLLQRIWSESKGPNPSVKQIKSGLSHYASLGDGYLEQYKYLLAALCLGAYRMKKRAYASKLSAKLLVVEPSFHNIMQDLRKNPLSHNYLLKLIYKD